MARRTAEGKRSSDESEALPLEQAAPRRRRLAPFWLVAAVFVVIVAGIWVFALTRSSPHAVKPPPAPSVAPSSPVAPSSAAKMPSATSIQAFAALPADQQKAIMQQAMDAAGEAISQVSRTLNASLLSEVATGAELQVLQQGLAQQQGRPESVIGNGTVLSVTASPAFGFVSVQVQGTETDQWLNPTTLQPTGTPVSGSSVSSYSLVIEGGVWKVNEHIQESGS
jgi:hypothetical protein